MKKEVKAYRPIYPSPAALISSIDAAGRPNIITLGEVFNISIREPVILGIAIRPATYSHGSISAAKEFVINLPTAAIVEKVDRCGTVSGRNCPDKFAFAGLTAIPSLKVKPPCIAECPVNIECELLKATTVGDHDLFFGTVVAMRVDEEKLGENGEIATLSLDPLIYITGEYWSIGRRIAALGFTARGRKG